MDIAVSAGHTVKIKKSKNVDKYRDNVKKPKKKKKKMLRNGKVIAMPVRVRVVVTTSPKNLEKILEEQEILGRIETVQTQAVQTNETD